MSLNVLTDGELLSKIAPEISRARHDHFLAAVGGARNAERALRLMVWNTEIGAALHPMLQLFELATRNVIAAALKAEYGDGWTQQDEVSRWSPRIAMDIHTAKARARRTNGPVGADDILANLSLGFWHDILKSCPDAFYDQRLGPKLKVLSYASKPRRRLLATVSGATRLRNRVYHLKPLINMDLRSEYDRMAHVVKRLTPWTWAVFEHKLAFDQFLARKP